MKRGFNFPQLLGSVGVILLMLMWVFPSVGCSSSSRDISNTATEIREVVEEKAEEIIGHAEATQEEVETLRTEENSEVVDSVQEHQESIIEASEEAKEEINEAVSNIHSEIPGVGDKESEWASTIKWVGIAVACTAVLFGLWRAGILTLLGKLIGLGTFWIPAATDSDARFAAKAIVRGTASQTERENIARKRDVIPGFDKAFRKHKGNEA